MAEPSLEQLARDIGELNREIAELESESSGREALDATRSDLETVRDFIDTSQSDIDGVKDDIAETVDQLKDMSSKLEDLLETREVKKFVEGVAGGLESTSNILGQVKGKLDHLDGLLERAQLADNLTVDDARSQLEALADAFETIVSDLGPLVDLVPGLGAFLQIYGMGIRNIAQSAGAIEEIVRRDNDLYETVRPGRHLYLTTESMRAERIRRLKAERARLEGKAMDLATEERVRRNEIAVGSDVSEVDQVVRAARDRSADALPALNSEARRAWAAASNALETAQKRREDARAALYIHQRELAAARIALETARSPGQRADLEARVQDSESTVERDRKRLERANAAYDEASATLSEAYEAHRAEIDAYDATVRDWIIKLAPHANKGRGFDESDWRTLERDYPQYAPIQTGVGSVIGKRRSKRMVLMGAGGILGVAVLVTAVVWIGGGEGPSVSGVGADDGTETAVAGDVGETETVSTTIGIQTTTTAELTACQAAAQQEYEMTFASSELGNVIPITYSTENSYDSGFATPSFEVDGVPEATTELAVLIMRVSDHSVDEVVGATDLWEDGVPPASPRWILTGVDPSLSAIPNTSLSLGLPEGAVERPHNTVSVQVDGEMVGNKFVGPDLPGQTFLFTLFALCDPQEGYIDDYQPGWFRRFALDAAWFTAESSW